MKVAVHITWKYMLKPFFLMCHEASSRPAVNNENFGIIWPVMKVAVHITWKYTLMILGCIEHVQRPIWMEKTIFFRYELFPNHISFWFASINFCTCRLVAIFGPYIYILICSRYIHTKDQMMCFCPLLRLPLFYPTSIECNFLQGFHYSSHLLTIYFFVCVVCLEFCRGFSEAPSYLLFNRIVYIVLTPNL